MAIHEILCPQYSPGDSRPCRCSTIRALGRFETRAAKGEVRAPKLKATRPKPEYPYEADEQKAFISWLDKQGIEYFAIPNGAYLAGHTNNERAQQWSKLRAMGAKTGVPDLQIVTPIPNNPARGLFVEMKRVRAARPEHSNEQKKWAQKLTAHGYIVIVAYGAQEAIAAIRALWKV